MKRSCPSLRQPSRVCRRRQPRISPPRLTLPAPLPRANRPLVGNPLLPGPTSAARPPFRAIASQHNRPLAAARRAALPALAALNNTVVLEDATVPRSRITDMLLALSEIGRKYNLVLGTFGHAGDGNLHPTILADKNNLDEMARVHKAVDEIFETALKFGGTLSGEHGIGIAKMKYLGNEIGESGLDLMRSIKNALDPTHMLNPGKLVPIKPIQEVAHATR